MLSAAPPKNVARLAWRRLGTLLLPLAWAGLWASGCGTDNPPGGTDNPAMDMASASPDLAQPLPMGTMGLPCDVATLLASKCTGCHNNPPQGAPMPLITYADLTAVSVVDSTKKVAERALIRMQDMMSPMPPGPTVTVTPAELAPFQTWVSAGMPFTMCKTMQPDPINAAPTCTSMKTWTQGETFGTLMHPGRACVTCHTMRKKGPLFDIAGTVYPTGHEPDDCLGGPKAPAMGNVTVVITDAAGTQHMLTPNANGNFTYQSKGSPFPLPYHAKVVYNGHERAMSAAQMSGDCNSCHTQQGANMAPGRITLPQ